MSVHPSNVPTLIMGTAFFGPAGTKTPFIYDSPEKAARIIDAWYDLGGRRLDTAAVYGDTQEYGPGGSERRLKEAKAGDRFVIDTKVRSVYIPSRAFAIVSLRSPPEQVSEAGAGKFSEDKIRKSVEKSLEDLGAPVGFTFGLF
jgi:aryl-alcohol dehydrogenase-like predicted oxidoreductase